MSRGGFVAVGLAALACVWLLPRDAWTQQSSGIAGAVRDTSGAVLPGVTVEAASPALIEKVRTVVTDGQGRYNIVDLRPGTYVVTFSLAGFRSVKREGIVLTAGFTAAVNADLAVGTLEETITVTGESPLVDTQNSRRQAVVSRDLLEVLPTSAKHVNTLVTLTPGLLGIPDAAGIYSTQVGNAFHGKTGTKTQFDGMGIQNMAQTGNSGYQVNTATVQELTLQTSGISAESNADGALINMIPKEGGNTFAGSVSGVYANDDLLSENLSDELRARGLTTVNKILRIYDATATLGGPIRKDRIWFFTAQREWGNAHQMAGLFWNKTQGTPFWTPDLDRPATRSQWYESHSVRVTWQASQTNKVNFFADVQDACVCRSGTTIQSGVAPEAVLAYHFRPTGLYQVTWSSPVTSRLLLEAGTGATVNHWPQFRSPGVEPHHISILEQSTGIRYNARETYADPNEQERYTQRFSMSYVTGSHAFKTGFHIEEGVLNAYPVGNGGDVSYTFRNQLPVSLTQRATPYLEKSRIKADLGIYAQDQWTVRRLTLNLGVRFDYFNAYVPAQEVSAGRFVGARSFAPVYGVPEWTDLNPRLGAAYDLFGNGRTALKVSLGRYVKKTAVDIAGANNPINSSVNNAARTWTDANGNYVPDCDLRNFAANGECGPINNQNFGKNNPLATRWADDVLRGFGVRGFNWDFSGEVQHQLGRGISVTAGYYRNWSGNFTVTDNLAATPADYGPFCVTAPADARLPGGGAYEVCGLYDIAPAKFGRVNNLVTQASHFGKQKQVNDFFNVGVTTRFASGFQFGGGVDTGRSVNDTCFVVDSPQQLLNCRIVTPFKALTEVKLYGSYPLPGDFVVSGVFQSTSGPPIPADYAASNNQIRGSLGRNLAACGGASVVCTATATVPLVKPQTLFEGRATRLDLRVSKLLRVGSRARLQGNFDVYNLLNAASILTTTGTYGPRWQLPTAILDARILQFGGQLTF